MGWGGYLHKRVCNRGRFVWLVQVENGDLRGLQRTRTQSQMSRERNEHPHKETLARMPTPSLSEYCASGTEPRRCSKLKARAGLVDGTVCAFNIQISLFSLSLSLSLSLSFIAFPSAPLLDKPGEMQATWPADDNTRHSQY